MSFFKKLKDRLFRSSSKLEEGIDHIVKDGGLGEPEGAPEPTPEPEAVPSQRLSLKLYQSQLLSQKLYQSQHLSLKLY